MKKDTQRTFLQSLYQRTIIEKAEKNKMAGDAKMESSAATSMYR